ncbi:DUF7742 family protein [Thalassococcus lentus]
MRPVLPDDLFAAARACLAVPPHVRFAHAQSLVGAAMVADAYRQRNNRLHPVFGGGTLMAAALAHEQVSEARVDNADFRECLIDVLRALRCLDQPDAQEIQREAVGSSSRRLMAISSPQSSQ